MHYIIYKTTNLINNKFYIGKHKTSNLQDGYLGSGNLILSAIKKYGIENFKKEILFQFSSEEEMNQKEKELITEEFLKRKDVYNLCPGGMGGFGYINKNIDFTIRNKTISKVRIKNGTYVVSAKNREISSATLKRLHKEGKVHIYDWTGRKQTEEHKRKIGLANSKYQIGSKNSQYGTMWITNGIINKKIKKEEIIPEGFRKGRIQ